MRDIDHLSHEYSVLQKRFDRIKTNPHSSASDFRKALQELAEAAKKLKEVTAEIAARNGQTNSFVAPYLRLVSKNSE